MPAEAGIQYYLFLDSGWELAGMTKQGHTNLDMP
jgi:hypothetical protein